MVYFLTERCTELIPNSAMLQRALLDVLNQYPSGLSSKEIDRLTALELGLSQEDLDLIRVGTRSEFAYRMAWERTHAKAKGLILKVEKRNWMISEMGKQKRIS